MTHHSQIGAVRLTSLFALCALIVALCALPLVGRAANERIGWQNVFANLSTTKTALPDFAGLTITKTDSQDPVTEGNNLTYTITVHNGLASTVTNVNVSDPLPANVTFIGASAGCTGTSTVTCTQASLPSGADAIFTITVAPTNAAANTTLSNTATVTSDQTTPLDATETTQVVAAACATPPAGMVAWYPGDGNAADIQGPTFENGALQGTFAAGRVGQAFSLNGTDQFVDIPDAPANSPATALSIDAWINPNNTSTDQAIVAKLDTCSGQQESYILILIPGGAIQFAVYNGQPGPNAFRAVRTSPGAVTAGVFTHVAATFDTNGQVMKIYINGVDSAAPSLAGSADINPIFDSNTPVNIGRATCEAFVPGPAYYFNGLIDEVELFDTAISAGDVAAIYNASSLGKCRTCSTINLDPASLPHGVQGLFYNQSITASGGTDSYTFTTADPLPNGVTLDSGGSLAGTPNETGTFHITVTATDTAGCTGTKDYDLIIDPAPTNFIVNSTGDGGDANPGDGTCDNGSGKCTLRAAMEEVNNLGGALGPLEIDFCIPASDPGHVYYIDDGTGSANGHVTNDGPHIGTTSVADDNSIGNIDPDYKHSWWLIAPATRLPYINEEVTINAYSQPGAYKNTKHLNHGDNAVLRIEVNGSALSNEAGFQLFAENTTISGLVVDHFQNDIYIEDNGGDTINGNFLGTDVSGTIADATNGVGVYIDSGEYDEVGGDTCADRNLISGHGGEGGAGVLIETSSISVEGNYIGTDRDGKAALGNTYGVRIRSGSESVVGCEVLDGDNVISGNTDTGVLIDGGDHNSVQGNFIGTDRTGCQHLPNGTGVAVSGSSSNFIGVPGFGNVISGNTGEGVELTNSTRFNQVQGNFIGIAADGRTGLGNGGNGVEVYVGTANNTIGVLPYFTFDRARNDAKQQQSAAAPAKASSVSAAFAPSIDDLVSGENVIAFNCEDGVRVTGNSDISNRISQNSIYANKLLGINLVSGSDGPDGVTPNDPCDTDDPGPNHLQNFPELLTADVATQTITGNLNSTFNGSYVIEFFLNPPGSCDSPSNHGEGKRFIGSVTTDQITDESCDVPFTFDQALCNFNAGDIITATATDVDGNTSEFSVCFTVPSTTGPVVNVTLASPSSGAVAEDGPTNLVYRFSRTPTTGPLVANFSASGSADSSNDYTVVSNPGVTFNGTTGTINFADGQDHVDVIVDPTADTHPEDDETVKFTVTSGAGYDVGAHATAKGTIKNDDNCPYVLVVNDAGDASDTTPGDGHCDTDGDLGNGDQCTLRAAIEEANALPACAPLEIDFNIAGAGVQTITPATPLPAIIQPVTIAGYTQPGAQANTDPNSDNAIIQIELNGANTGANANGLVLDTGSDLTIIEGLAINRFNGAGIVINSNANEISGNFIGTDALGTSAGVNRAYGNGVGVLVYGVLNEVGCTFSDMRNVISGNHLQGVSVMGGFINFVQGNFIGTDKTGTSLIGLDNEPMGNGGAGVEICGDAGPIIVGAFSGELVAEPAASGAKSSSATNLTSDRQAGMADRVSARRNEIARRFLLKHSATANGISTQRRAMVNNMTRRSSLAKSNLAAKSSSIALEDSGGDISGANIIAGNGGGGVLVTSDDNLDIIISQNSIYSNGGLGINLVDNVHAEPPNTVTPNDDGDVDDGPNNLQNFPVITSVDVATQTIQGTLHSQANNPDGYLIEFFVSPSCDPSGYGEGKKFIGDLITDPTNASGDVSFTFNPPPLTFAAGDVITATATDIDGNTSEFSPCSVFLTVSKSQPSPALFVSQDSTYTITVTNSGTTPVTTATVKEAIPAGMDLTSATGTNWICSPAGPASDPVGTVTCNFSGSLAASGTSSIAIVVRPKPAIGGQSVTNNYSIDSAGGTNPPAPTTCTAANVPAVGCGVPVVSNVGAPVCPAITVDPAALANGIQNVPYSQTVTASGGSGSYSFLVTGGALPDGLSLSSGGLLDGTPTTPGTFNFTITATDSGTCTGSRAYTISICPSTFFVNSTGDSGDVNWGDGVCATSGGVCTLRAAIEEANHLSTCGAININFAIGSQTIILNNPDGRADPQLTIDHDVSIVGPTTSSVIVSGNMLTRLFTVNNSRTASIANLTLTRGNGSGGDGGAVKNNGTLTLNGVTLGDPTIGNSAVNGGAVRNDGSLVLINTTISGNLATGDGGGLYNANNQATLTNVTVAYNRANSDSNASGTGGGVSVAGGSVLLHNTIVTDNYNGGSPSTTADNIGGLVDSSSSYNLVGNGNLSGGLSNGGANHNQTGVATALLGALMNNKGPTLTHGLLYNSPAIDAGDASVLPLLLDADQRGLSRPDDGDNSGSGGVDIGAYERQLKETRPATGGSNSSVDINDVRLTFPSADSEGQNSVELTVVAVPNDAPAGSGPAFDIHPTSNFYTPPVTMCFYLPSISNPATFAELKVYHREGAALVEHAATGDFASRTVCVNDINSFSIFVLNQPTINPTAANGNINGQVLDSNGQAVDGAAVRLSGTQDRLTITDAAGNYHFDNVETNGFYVVTPSRANFNFSPAQRSFSQLGAHTDAVFTGTPTSTVVNPLDATEYFVRQQYLDFLGREPDESGFNFWVNNIESCGNDSACREVKRIDTSAAFFLSIEFQQTGYLVYRAYEAAYGDSDSVPVPLTLQEFTPDTRSISKGVVVLQSDWPQELEANKQAFMTEFVQRQRFTSAYPTSLTPAQFVEKLFATARVESSDSDYAATVAMFGAAIDTSDVAARARVLRRLAENSSLTRRNFNRAFVLMEYFGYLRRDPNSGPDTDFSGYNSWLDKLNRFDGNFDSAEMVKAFLSATEFRGRFPR